ncbi:hypothetical protein GCM10029992_07950 [Glycomyces albus]
MTVDDVLSELGIARSTFHQWRKTGLGPRYLRLPNGGIRVLRSEFLRWLSSMQEGRS